MVSEAIVHNFLQSRKQHVKIQSVISKGRVVDYGIPQGTVLGPILFTIYINDIFTINTAEKIISYSNDTRKRG